MKKVLIDLDELHDICCDSVIFYEGSEDYSINGDLIAKRFESLPAAPKWVGVEDGLPSHGQRVFIRNGDIILALVFNKKLNVFMSRASSALHHNIKSVTHWMPIPALPGEENE